MLVTPSGDIIIAGTTHDGGMEIAKFSANGLLDPSFGTSGIYQFSGSASVNYYQGISMAFGPNGSVYIAGEVVNKTQTSSFSLIKINTSGTKSSSYNYSVEEYSGGTAVVYANGILVMGGFSSSGDPGSVSDDSQFTFIGVNTNGTIDRSFGTNGIVRTSIEATSSVSGMAVSPNGDIVAVGNAIHDGIEYNPNAGGITSDIALARYTPSGKLDSTFGNSGIVVTLGSDDSVFGTVDVQYVYTQAIAVEADGSVIIAGNASAFGEGQFLTMHYSDTGGFIGIGLFDASSAVGGESFEAVALDGNSIIVAGYADVVNLGNEYFDVILAKLNSNLTLDSDFAKAESVAIPQVWLPDDDSQSASIGVGNPDGFVATQAFPSSVTSAVDSSGNIFVLGPGATDSDNPAAVHLAKYLSNGSRDISFQATQGIAGSALAVQTDGKILVAGDPVFGFHRLNSDGSIDTSFTATGPALTGATSIVELTNDDLLVAVGADIYRFFPDGTFDTTFGIAGVATNANLIISEMTVKQDGSIVVVGGDTVEEFTAAGLIDTTFNTTGQVSLTNTPQYSESDPATAVLIDTQGNILVGGSDQVVALSANGSLDSAFGNGGVQFIFTPSTSVPLDISALALDLHGNVLVGGIDLGLEYFPGEQDLVRLTPAGQLDASFGDDGFTDVMPMNSSSDYYTTAIYSNAVGQIYLVGLADVYETQNYAITISRFNDGTSISGTVFNDANGDGKQETGEAGIAGRTVYVDLNNNGKLDPGEPYAVTNAQGQYTLTGLPAGALLIRQVLPAGQRESTPAYGGAFHVTLGTTPLINIDFGSTNTIYISGEVFNDTNGNGELDAGEIGIANVRVYIDLANTGSYVPSDNPSVITNSAGDFVFTGLAAATYILRIAPTTGYTQTDPADNGYELVALPSGGVKMNLLLGEKKIA